MFEKPKKAVLFKTACQMGNNRGLFEVGEDGTVLVNSLDCRNGKETAVVLATTEEELHTLIAFLMHCADSHAPTGSGQIDNEPSEQSMDELMANLKNNNLH